MSKIIKISITRKIPLNYFPPFLSRSLVGLSEGNTIIIEFEKKSQKNLFIINLVSSIDKYSREWHRTESFNLMINDFRIGFKNGIQLSVDLAPSYLKNTISSLNSLINKTLYLSGDPFYSCNTPEDLEGYMLKELSEDIYTYKKEPVEIELSTQIGKHRTHYLKWIFLENSNISIRYHFIFNDKKEYENKYIWKDHISKISFILSKEEAEVMINSMGFSKSPIEIAGRLINKKYEKSILNFSVEK